MTRSDTQWGCAAACGELRVNQSINARRARLLPLSPASAFSLGVRDARFGACACDRLTDSRRGEQPLSHAPLARRAASPARSERCARAATLLALRTALALQPRHTPRGASWQLHVTAERDDLRDEIARRNAAKADAPRVRLRLGPVPGGSSGDGFRGTTPADAPVQLGRSRFGCLMRARAPTTRHRRARSGWECCRHRCARCASAAGDRGLAPELLPAFAARACWRRGRGRWNTAPSRFADVRSLNNRHAALPSARSATRWMSKPGLWCAAAVVCEGSATPSLMNLSSVRPSVIADVVTRAATNTCARWRRARAPPVPQADF